MSNTLGTIIPPVDSINVTIDNKTGQVQILMSRPLPFPMVAMILGKLIGQLGEQAAGGPPAGYSAADPRTINGKPAGTPL